MIEAIERIRFITADLSLDAFEADWQKRWLVERGLEASAAAAGPTDCWRSEKTARRTSRSRSALSIMPRCSMTRTDCRSDRRYLRGVRHPARRAGSRCLR